MKLQIVTISAFICAVAATAVPNRLHFDSSPIRRTSEVGVRQTVTDEENELEDDACRDVTFIFARGSTEPGNMVRGN
jgi:cutinase